MKKVFIGCLWSVLDFVRFYFPPFLVYCAVQYKYGVECVTDYQWIWFALFTIQFFNLMNFSSQEQAIRDLQEVIRNERRNSKNVD